MDRFERWYRALYAVARAGSLLGGLLLLASAVAITIDIVMRKALNTSLGGATELAGFALAIASAWSYSFVLLERGHIRVTTAWQYLPRPLRTALDMVSNLALLLLVQFIAWNGAKLAIQSFDLGTQSMSRLSLPIWIVQGFWAMGMIYFCIVAVFLAIYAAVAARQGRPDIVDRLIGQPTVDEEVAREVRASTNTGN